MRRVLVCTIVLAVVPMALLNPMDPPSVSGLLLGVVTTWFVVAAIGHVRANGAMAPR